jgi:hypothetical protein
MVGSRTRTNACFVLVGRSGILCHLRKDSGVRRFRTLFFSRKREHFSVIGIIVNYSNTLRPRGSQVHTREAHTARGLNVFLPCLHRHPGVGLQLKLRHDEISGTRI